MGMMDERSMNGNRNGVVKPPSTIEFHSDEELMSQLAAGRSEALEPLYGRYTSLVFGLAARTFDRATAEEITQEVFLAVWQKAATFDPARGTFSAWVAKITHTRVRNELRRRGRRPRTTSDSQGTGAENRPDSVPDPADVAWHEHRRAAVRAAVDALPTAQREALSIAFLQDLTNEQAAAFLNLPLGTTKSRIRAGLKTLRLRLAPLVTAGLILAGLLTFAGLRERAHQAALRRQDRALRLVTNSEVLPRRLGAAPGTNPAAHGNYRGRPGVDLAVLTLSYLAPAPRGYEYRAWTSHGGRWTLLGRVQLDGEGRSLIIAEGPELATPPDRLQVTLEPVGNRTDAGAAPTGAPVIRWPAP
jgi:RNA polymerase sigma-70 factor (ECF subfamily)